MLQISFSNPTFNIQPTVSMQTATINRKILVVEDNPAQIRLIQEALKQSSAPHEITAVNDGVEAMAYLRQEEPYSGVWRPDIILLDLNLPRKNGREVLAELKTDPQLKRIPVLVMTTSRHAEDIAISYDMHANCYINKSRNLKHLLTIVRRIEEFWLDTVTLPEIDS